MVRNIPNSLSAILVSALVASCSINERPGKLIVTEITESGTDEAKQEFCSDFSLSKKAAEAFFGQAKPISVEELHDTYDFLPCYTRGKAVKGKEQCHWEIRAGGTGDLTCGANATKLLACDDCLPTP